MVRVPKRIWDGFWNFVIGFGTGLGNYICKRVRILLNERISYPLPFLLTPRCWRVARSCRTLLCGFAPFNSGYNIYLHALMRLNMKILGSLMEAFTSQSMNTIKTGLIWVLRAGWMAGTLPILVASLPSSRLKSFHKLLLGFSRRGKILPSSSQVRTQFSFTIFSTNKKPFFSSFFLNNFFFVM